jgi:hypothetical protein
VSERVDPAGTGRSPDRLRLARVVIGRLARPIVRTLLGGTRHGALTIIEGGRGRPFGAAAAGAPAPVVVVHDSRFYSGLLRGSLGVSEAYSEGWFDCSDLAELARLAALNMPALDRWRRGVRPFVAGPQALLSWCARNTPKRSRRRIAAHYDIGNELFSLMLDETMTYSCAIFESPEASLHQAQIAKLDRICRKLELTPQDHVLEIGTGWGGFAIHAASQYGCRVTTTTISGEQHRLALERIRAAGLEDRITVLLEDYRDLRGPVRQARLDRDDRGRWLAVLRHLLRALRIAAGAGRRDAAAGDHDRRTRLRRREGQAQLRQHARLPRRLPARRCRSSRARSRV